MLKKSLSIIYFFRLLWIALALLLVFFVLGKNVFTARTMVYYLDFTKPISRDTNGWYPQQRLAYTADGLIELKGEPLYLKAYVPVRFDTLIVKGTVIEKNIPIRLGLKQEDNSWLFKDVFDNDMTITFMLDKAKVQRRQIELILSMPKLTSTSTIKINNNWQLIFQR